MINTITKCLLDANDHAYILLSNKIEALQPSLNLAEFGQGTVNIGLGITVLLIIILITLIKKNGFNKDAKIFSVFLGLFALLVAGGFMYYQNDISEIETEITLLQQELTELEQPSSAILKACLSEGRFLSSSKDDEIILLTNKDNEASSYTVTEK